MSVSMSAMSTSAPAARRLVLALPLVVMMVAVVATLLLLLVLVVAAAVLLLLLLLMAVLLPLVFGLGAEEGAGEGADNTVAWRVHVSQLFIEVIVLKGNV
jgi:hypothetical protein